MIANEFLKKNMTENRQRCTRDKRKHQRWEATAFTRCKAANETYCKLLNKTLFVLSQPMVRL